MWCHHHMWRMIALPALICLQLSHYGFTQEIHDDFMLIITLSFFWSLNTDQTHHRLVQTWKWQNMHYFAIIIYLWRKSPGTHRIKRTTTNSMFYPFSVSIAIILVLFSCSFWCMCSSSAFTFVMTWPWEALIAIADKQTA